MVCFYGTTSTGIFPNGFMPATGVFFGDILPVPPVCKEFFPSRFFKTFWEVSGTRHC
jgi:hypothetical protein